VTKTLYFGNLPWSMTEDGLKTEVEAFAIVKSVRIITDKITQRSRGFGFVEVEDTECDDVIKGMNEVEIGGRPLVVNEARPRTYSNQ